MELTEVMRTTFACREFTAEDVPDGALRRILDVARFAPNGGNRQGWKVLVVRDPATRAALGPLMLPAMQRYFAQRAAGEMPWNPVHPTRLDADAIAAFPVPERAVKALTDAPVLLFVLIDLTVVAAMDQDLDRIGVIPGASIYPFAHNILLAARNEGYGGVLTTFISAQEPALQRLLGIPSHVAFAAMIPLGRPVKQLTRLTRNPVDDFAMRERWGGPPLQGD